MTTLNSSLINSSAWQALKAHQHDIAQQTMRDWFAEDSQRFNKFSISAGGILLDYSRNRIQPKTMELLVNLAYHIDLKGKISDLFGGVPVNVTEKRPALHTALRKPTHQTSVQSKSHIHADIEAVQQRMRHITTDIHQKKWLGYTGKPINTIVNLGIGGSHLGPLMATQALKNFAVSRLDFHFISSVDAEFIDDVLATINPETSLFIIASKSFTTLETLANARKITTWLQQKLGTTNLKQHLVAITSAPDKAVAFGVDKNHILPMWDWVGGRYSIWSAIGLPLMLMIGEQHFADFLAGAHAMDEHFQQADFTANMPVLMGLLGIWYQHFFQASAHAVVPYAHRLRYFIPYLQQLVMESNGKSVMLDGEPADCLTGPIIFGEEGCDGQHAYHQLLHQGRQLIPVDFILVGGRGSDTHHQDLLIASGLSQAQALMQGKTYEEAYTALLAKRIAPKEAAWLAKHQVIAGNKPSNILLLDQLTPRHLGALIALYEHQVFVQGVIWNINSFDQWGVELGKQLLPAILEQVQGTSSKQAIDTATSALIRRYQQTKGQS